MPSLNDIQIILIYYDSRGLGVKLYQTGCIYISKATIMEIKGLSQCIAANKQ